MANLPANRTKLQVAITNQQPSIVASSQANREAMVEAYDTIDLLYQMVSGLVAGGQLVPFPPDAISRQAIINGNFDVWQRGTSFTNPTSYTCDRFLAGVSNTGVLPTTIVHSRQTLAPGDIPGAFNFYRVNVNGAGSGFGTNDVYNLQHRIEHGTRLLCGNGKKLTLSFWARSDIPGKKLGIAPSQSYGSGGSPSVIDSLSGKFITLTNTWTKYTYTFTTNTLAGKTFGTNNDDFIIIAFGLMWGATRATVYGDTVGETFGGAGNIDIAQVQVNAGESALPFQPRSFAEELALCRRYCYAMADDSNAELLIGNGYAATASIALVAVPFPVEMRIQPILGATATDWKLIDGITGTVLTSLSIQPGQNGKNGLVLRAQVAAGLTAFRPYSLTANAAVNRRIVFESEL